MPGRHLFLSCRDVRLTHTEGLEFSLSTQVVLSVSCKCMELSAVSNTLIIRLKCHFFFTSLCSCEAILP